MFKAGLLKDKVILVTGGGSGLGKSMVASFLKNGAKCIISGRREEVLVETAKELDPGGESILPIPCDVRYTRDVEKMLDIAHERFERIDVLLNNAAGNFVSPTERLSPNAFKLIIDIVLMGTINCTTLLGKRWIKQGKGGTVLNILTTYASTGSGYVVPSACAKAGVEAMTKSLAAEWGRKFNIRFVGIAPGPFPTKGAWSRLLPDPKLEEYSIDRIPLKRFGKHEELTNLATYLVSDQAAYINGEVVRIDGGEAQALAGEFCFLDSVSDESWDLYEQEIKKNTQKKKEG